MMKKVEYSEILYISSLFYIFCSVKGCMTLKYSILEMLKIKPESL